MQRRRFLTQAAAAAGAGLAVAGLPAAAQEGPSVRWRMSTGWPKSLDAIYGSAEELCKRVSELTGGKFEIRAFPGGELVPYAQNMEAVSNGTIECNHVLSTAHLGTNTAVAFDTGLSFGMNARQVELRVHEGNLKAEASVAASPRLAEALQAIRAGIFSADDPSRFVGLIDQLLQHDRYLVCADFDAYWQAQARVEALWQQPPQWWRSAVLNTARTGWFSADRTIGEYAREIWQVME